MRGSTRTYGFTQKEYARQFANEVMEKGIDFTCTNTQYGTVKIQITTTVENHKALKETYSQLLDEMFGE